MHFLNNEIIYFVLHDCCFDRIEITDFGLSLSFKDGIYVADGNSDYRLSESCCLDLFINNFRGNEDCHFSAIKTKRARLKELSFNEFVRLLNESKFRVYIDYYSDFAKAIYIKGKIEDVEIEINITEIENLRVRSLNF